MHQIYLEDIEVLAKVDNHCKHKFREAIVREIFASPYAILQRGPYSISLCRLIFPVTKIQRQKYNIFPLVRILHTIQQAYTQAAPLQPAYIEDLCQKMKIKCRVSMSRQEISDPWPSIYWKHSDSALQFHFEGYKWANSELWKRRRIQL
jgi:hypothetical protein